MAKRGYKLQEFIAHSANVNCLSIGKKACRLLLTGGDDQKVNLWSIGKPTSLMSLCGHTSPVESVAFDSAEVLVLAGASAGVIKLWDLEGAKMVRTLAGHRSNCTAVEFHPFGEFFASGSMDTNLRIWDIRKKGCIHTYKGHSRGISTIRFTPDGRWVVSGGFDNVVKVWDLTAGKLLHDFKFHEGHIRSIDFHPLEFLLATGSADRTVKFWDLETFELIGSARPEGTGVRTIAFHPDGRTLFCGLDDSLKVYSWEPVICHDTVDMGWSTLGDLCINDGKLLGCSFYRNSVGVWVANVSHIEPYGPGVPEQNDCTEKKLNPQGTHSLEKVGSGMRSTSGLRCSSPDYDTKEIKTIYVDSTGGNPVASQKVGSLNSPKVVLPLDSKEISDLQTEKQSAAFVMEAKSNAQELHKSFVVPSIKPCESPGKDSSNSGRESITFSRTKPGMLLKPAHVRRPSNSKVEAERLSTGVESGSFSNIKSDLDSAKDTKFQTQLVSNDGARNSYEQKDSDIKSVTEKIRKVLSPQGPLKHENCDESLDCSKGSNSVKFVNGVAVVRGRTRSLVERFERRERFDTNDDEAISITSETRVTSNGEQTTIITPGMRLNSNEDRATNVAPQIRTNSNADEANNTVPHVRLKNSEDQANHTSPSVRFKNSEDQATNTTPPVRFKNSEDQAMNISPMRFKKSEDRTTNTSPPVRFKNSEDQPTNATPRMRFKNNEDQAAYGTPYLRFKNNVEKATNSAPHVRYNNEVQATIISHSVKAEADEKPTNLKREPHVQQRDTTSANEGEVIENMMQTHDVFISTLRSRLTKLQVVRHFWERNDIKGAIGAMRKLPDHSLQADTISILMEKMEILNLDLFLCLLPVLVGLLDSKIERHANISLEMLLKLVAVFGPMIRSTVSAPPAVGVDLHAEQRRECCKQCFVQLQNIQKVLPALVRRGGLLAKSAAELNLVLQES